MECRSFVDAMMEAEPAVLRGKGATALAVHIRTCIRCARRAQLVLGATEALAAELDIRSEAKDAARSRVIVAAAGARPGIRQSTWRARTRRSVLVALPAAAALVLAVGLDRLGDDGANAPAVDSASVTQPSPDMGGLESPDVVVRPGQNAVVFRTSNPKITVVWYYSTQGGP
ncbi:MAG: hypothetical protein ACREL7_13435 [Longimicrobiales bacterium]